MTPPRILISRSELDEVLASGAPTGGRFSCNARCEVWLTSSRGRIPYNQRQYVDLPALDEIAGAVVDAIPKGARFLVTQEGVHLVGLQELLYVFEVVEHHDKNG